MSAPTLTVPQQIESLSRQFKSFRQQVANFREQQPNTSPETRRGFAFWDMEMFALQAVQFGAIDVRSVDLLRPATLPQQLGVGMLRELVRNDEAARTKSVHAGSQEARRLFQVAENQGLAEDVLRWFEDDAERELTTALLAAEMQRNQTAAPVLSLRRFVAAVQDTVCTGNGEPLPENRQPDEIQADLREHYRPALVAATTIGGLEVNKAQRLLQNAENLAVTYAAIHPLWKTTERPPRNMDSQHTEVCMQYQLTMRELLGLLAVVEAKAAAPSAGILPALTTKANPIDGAENKIATALAQESRPKQPASPEARTEYGVAGRVGALTPANSVSPPPTTDHQKEYDFGAAEEATRALASSIGKLQDAVEFNWEKQSKARYALAGLAEFYWECAWYAERFDPVLAIARQLAATRQTRFEFGPFVGESATMALWQIAAGYKSALDGFGLLDFWRDIASTLSSYPAKLSPSEIGQLVWSWLDSPKMKKRLPDMPSLSCALAFLWIELQHFDEVLFLAEIGLEFARTMHAPTSGDVGKVDVKKDEQRQSPSLADAKPMSCAGQTPAPALDDEDERILRALGKQPHRLLTQDAIEAESGVSRKTISSRIKQLLAAGLVAQPKGPKSGTTITPSGLELCNPIEGSKSTR